MPVKVPSQKDLFAGGASPTQHVRRELPRQDPPEPFTRGPPLVCCGECVHFTPDDIGDGQGVGTCALDYSSHTTTTTWPADFRRMPPYPRAERYCDKFKRIK